MDNYLSLQSRSKENNVLYAQKLTKQKYYFIITSRSVRNNFKSLHIYDFIYLVLSRIATVVKRENTMLVLGMMHSEEYLEIILIHNKSQTF